MQSDFCDGFSNGGGRGWGQTTPLLQVIFQQCNRALYLYSAWWLCICLSCFANSSRSARRSATLCSASSCSRRSCETVCSNSLKQKHPHNPFFFKEFLLTIIYSYWKESFIIYCFVTMFLFTLIETFWQIKENQQYFVQ